MKNEDNFTDQKEVNKCEKQRINVKKLRIG